MPSPKRKRRLLVSKLRQKVPGESAGRYLLITTFASYEAYKRWRQVEEEGPDYWERYTSILVHWEQLSHCIEEYAGEVKIDEEIDI